MPRRVPARAAAPCSSCTRNRGTPRPASAASWKSCSPRRTDRVAARPAAMADTPRVDRLPLRLAAIFPAVPAEAWTAAIRRDLGTGDDGASASFPGALAWDIGDGIRIPPYARREDLGTLPPAPLTHRRCEWRAPGSLSGLAIRVGPGVDGLTLAAGQALDRGGAAITFVVEPSAVLFLEIARQRALRRVCVERGLHPAIHADVRVAAAADPV